MIRAAVRRSIAIEYLTRLRMLLAEDRMAGTTDSIAEIARSLGYESASAFTKVFKRVTGHSPRQQRQRLGIPAVRGQASAEELDQQSRSFNVATRPMTLPKKV